MINKFTSSVQKLIVGSLAMAVVATPALAQVTESGHSQTTRLNMTASQVAPTHLLAQVGPPKLQPKYVEIASVLSGPKPSSGQKNRSSGNFSIDGLPGGTNTLYWQVVKENGQSVDPNIRFNVMDDKSVASDPVVFSNLANESRTSVKTDRSFYIARPQGANQNFIVKVYAVYF